MVDWFTAMRRGDFGTAWSISDRILVERGASEPDRSLPLHQQWVWNGADLHDRRVLVRCYHGLGDTIQFARFLPALNRIARELTVSVQPPLVPLLERTSGIGYVVPMDDASTAVDYDVEIEIMELAHAFRTTIDRLPPPLELGVPNTPRLSGRFSVGLVAEAGDWDPRRSVPPNELDLETPDVDFFNLQVRNPLPGMTDASTPNVLSAAARLRALDLVITVDTMMAHLAGTLGVRTWVLLPAEADWRWLERRADSPWYPGMRLFRQPAPGEWRPVIVNVKSALARLKRQDASGVGRAGRGFARTVGGAQC